MRYLDERLQLLHDRGALAPALDPGAAAMLLQGVLLTFAMSAAMGESPAATTLPARIDAAWYTLCSVLFT